MNPFRTIWKAVSSIGMKLWGRLIGGRNSYATGVWGGWGGLWGADRFTQADQFRGWQFVAGNTIGMELAQNTPKCAKIVEPGMKRPGKSYLAKSMRRKAISQAQEHEEFELLPSHHALPRLLARPNPSEVSWQFWYRVAMWWTISANIYLWKVRNKLGRIVELYVIPSTWVWPRPGVDDQGNPMVVAWYDIRPMGINTALSAGTKFEVDEVLHIKRPSPMHFVDGYATSQAIPEWLDIARNQDRSQKNQFDQGFQPGPIIKVDKEVQDPTPEEVERFKAQFKRSYAGVEKAGMPFVLSPGMEGIEFGMTPKEMDYLQSCNLSRDNILAAYGVSKTTVGIVDTVNRASMDTARAAYLQGTINPILTLIGQCLTEEVARDFDDSLVIYWLDQTPKDRQQTLAEYTAADAHVCVTRNEWRQNVLDLEPFKNGGDTPVGPMGLVEYPVEAQEPFDWAKAVEEAKAEGQPKPEPGKNGKPGETPNRIAAALNGRNGHA